MPGDDNEKGGGVAKDTCKVCRESLLGKLDTNEKYIQAVEETAEKRLDSHADEIKELRRVTIELVSMQKQLIELQKENSERIKLMEERLSAPAPKKSWYESDIGKFLIKAGVIAIFALLAAAVGKSFIEALKPITTAIPK